MELEQKPNWRQRLVAWLANFLGVQIYPAPFAIMVYDMSGDVAEYYKRQRDEEAGLH